MPQGLKNKIKVDSLKRNLRISAASLRREAQFGHNLALRLSNRMIATIAFAYIASAYVEYSVAELSFNTLWLRIGVALSLLPLLFKDYWPFAAKKHGYLISNTIIGVIFPLCFGLILILNAAWDNESNSINIFATMEYVLSTFLLVQIVFHVRVVVVIWSISSLLVAICTCFVTNPNLSLIWLHVFYVIPFFLTILLVGGIINQTVFVFQDQKEKAVWNVANAIAHQLRTPLATIRNLSHGTRTHVPMLVEKYRLAMEIDSTLKPLSNRKLELLNDALVNIEEEVEYSNALIDILIANSRPFEYAAAPGQSIWITTAIETAVNTYPYNNPRERSLVNYNPTNSFKVDASERMICHVMYNLIGNAVEFSQKKPDGKIRIWLEQGEQWNKVIVWDSGIGVPRHFQHQVFDMFFSRNSPNGTGIGLSFCKAVMEGIGGKIECQTQANEYCQFTLSFPHPAV